MWQKKKKKTDTKRDLRLLFGQRFNHIYTHTHSICQRISDFKFNEARSPLFQVQLSLHLLLLGAISSKENDCIRLTLCYSEYNTIISNPKRETILFYKLFSSTIMYHGLLYITIIHQQNRHSAVSPFFLYPYSFTFLLSSQPIISFGSDILYLFFVVQYMYVMELQIPCISRSLVFLYMRNIGWQKNLISVSLQRHWNHESSAAGRQSQAAALYCGLCIIDL